MASIQFTEADRDERGFVKVPPPAEPRLLADLLPSAASAKAPAHPPLSRQELISALVIVPLLLGALLYVSSGRTSAPGAIMPTPAPAAPTSAPAPTAPPVTMLPAYGAPFESSFAQIEATRAITPTAHYGDGWIQADVQGSGLIWLRASDFPALAIVGPDHAPRPAAEIAPVYAQAPAPEPEPPQCAEAGIPGKMVRVCGTDGLAALEQRAQAEWLAQYGGNLGALDSPTPMPFQRQDAIQNRLANEHIGATP